MGQIPPPKKLGVRGSKRERFVSLETITRTNLFPERVTRFEDDGWQEQEIKEFLQTAERRTTATPETHDREKQQLKVLYVEVFAVLELNSQVHLPPPRLGGRYQTLSLLPPPWGEQPIRFFQPDSEVTCA